MINELYRILKDYPLYIIEVSTPQVHVLVGASNLMCEHGIIFNRSFTIKSVNAFTVTEDEDGITVHMGLVKIHCIGKGVV